MRAFLEYVAKLDGKGLTTVQVRSSDGKTATTTVPGPKL
jgi:hypothetical protein